MALVWTVQLLLLLISFHNTAANCDDPTVPTNGSIYGAYQNTTEGNVIEFGCNPGFVPTENMTAVCASDGRWIPDPATLVCTLVSQVSLLPWHIALLVLGVLALLVSIVVILTGMLAICGFCWCCWMLVIGFLMGSFFGVPIGLALILHNSKKAANNEQCRNSASLSNRITWSGRAGYFYGFYHFLTIYAGIFIGNGLICWILFAVFATRPANDDSRIRITVLVAFCLSIAALILTIVSVIFIIPYRKYKDECKDDYGQMGISDKPADGDNPEDERMKEAEDY